jgi:hypothetical protein
VTGMKIKKNIYARFCGQLGDHYTGAIYTHTDRGKQTLTVQLMRAADGGGNFGHI